MMEESEFEFKDVVLEEGILSGSKISWWVAVCEYIASKKGSAKFSEKETFCILRGVDDYGEDESEGVRTYNELFSAEKSEGKFQRLISFMRDLLASFMVHKEGSHRLRRRAISPRSPLFFYVRRDGIPDWLKEIDEFDIYMSIHTKGATVVSSPICDKDILRCWYRIFGFGMGIQFNYKRLVNENGPIKGVKRFSYPGFKFSKEELLEGFMSLRVMVDGK